MRRYTTALAGALLALAVPATASAGTVFGSPLDHAANVIPYINGWDQNVFNTAGPVGVVAPRTGLVEQIKVRGGSADGQPLEVKFRVIRPDAGGFRAISTPVIATLPPNDDRVHTYTVPDPRSFRVQPGDMIAIFEQGYGGLGRPWQIFSRQSGWRTQKVAVHDGFKDGDLSPLPPVDAEGHSTVTYDDTELLLQAVMSEDQCPGTDLPQMPCQSKLYLGGKVKKGARSFRYTWTLRNGGPHPAAGVNVRFDLPRGTRVPAAPAGCEITAGPPFGLYCSVGDVASPQLGNAVRRVTFTAVPKKVTRHFRATGEIDAPNIVDPNGNGRHVKTVSASTKYHGPTAIKR
jgi:hypothetical protein